MRSVENRWRESSRPLTVYGVPVGMFLIYLVWCKFPTFMTLWICTGVLTFFGVAATSSTHGAGKPEGRSSLVVSPLL